MVRYKHNPERRHSWKLNNIFSTYGWRCLSTRNCKPSRRKNRRQSSDRNNRTKYCYYFLIGLLTVNPAFANEEPTVQNSSNPVAAATGNVTNQAVQFQNNGAPSRQYFAANSSCNGTTMQFSPFYMGNDTIPNDSSGYVRSNNFGLQLNFSVPLDGGCLLYTSPSPRD